MRKKLVEMLGRFVGVCVGVCEFAGCLVGFLAVVGLLGFLAFVLVERVPAEPFALGMALFCGAAAWYQGHRYEKEKAVSRKLRVELGVAESQRDEYKAALERNARRHG